MAAEMGISASSVQRLWRDNDLKSHLRRTFKLSNDRRFEEKFWDIIGLYLNPPDKALVLCCDEETQCQALERTQPGLPLGIGHIRTHTHDYIRHGTVTLFAALSSDRLRALDSDDIVQSAQIFTQILQQINRSRLIVAKVDEDNLRIGVGNGVR